MVCIWHTNMPQIFPSAAWTGSDSSSVSTVYSVLLQIQNAEPATSTVGWRSARLLAILEFCLVNVMGTVILYRITVSARL